MNPLFKGFPDGRFGPDEELTEGQFSKVVARLFDATDRWTRAETATLLYACLPAFAGRAGRAGGGTHHGGGFGDYDYAERGGHHGRRASGGGVRPHRVHPPLRVLPGAPFQQKPGRRGDRLRKAERDFGGGGKQDKRGLFLRRRGDRCLGESGGRYFLRPES